MTIILAAKDGGSPETLNDVLYTATTGNCVVIYFKDGRTARKVSLRNVARVTTFPG